MQCFSTEKILIEQEETFLKINAKQIKKLKSDSIKFKNNFKQLAVPFKIYADFESVFKEVESNDRDKNTSYTEIYQSHIPCSFAYKVVCMKNLANQLFFTKEKLPSINLLKQFLKK